MKTSKEESFALFFFLFHFFLSDLPQESRTVSGSGTQSEIDKTVNE